jgi:hypothetical protein
MLESAYSMHMLTKSSSVYLGLVICFFVHVLVLNETVSGFGKKADNHQSLYKTFNSCDFYYFSQGWVECVLHLRKELSIC